MLFPEFPTYLWLEKRHAYPKNQQDAAGYKLLFIKIPDPDFHNIPHMYSHRKYHETVLSYHIGRQKNSSPLFQFLPSLPASVHYERKGTPQSRAGPLLKNLICSNTSGISGSQPARLMPLPSQKQKLYPFSPKIRQRFPDIIHIGASNW